MRNINYRNAYLKISVQDERISIKYNEEPTAFLKATLQSNGFTRTSGVGTIYEAPVNQRSTYFCQVNGLVLK